ncbi:MAG: hypothetical protein WCT14_03915 [Treponemataceae bacterium]
MTVADWKAALLTLNDGPFFDLMRSYLGDIRTPFNKQRLIDELEGFLGRKDIQELIASYLDDTDKLVIAAMGALGDPVADELASFFDGELSYAELHAVLLNLEERLIIYRFTDGTARRLALNPTLAPVLDPFASNVVSLFPSIPLSSAPAVDTIGMEPFDDLFLASVVSYVRRRAELFRSDGSYRKKALEDVSAAFSADRFMAAVGALHALGVLDMNDSGVKIDEARLAAFAALSHTDRAFYLAAGVCGTAPEVGSPNKKGRVPRERLTAWTRLFKTFTESLEADLAYPAATMNRLLDAAERLIAAPRRRRWEARAADPGAELRFGADLVSFRVSVLKALVSAGVLTAHADSYYSLAPARHRNETSPDAPKSPVLSADAAFSIIVYPEIDFPDALGLTRFLDIREAGRTARFELCRESAVRAFNGGLMPDSQIATLERLSGRPVSQNVRWSLKEWHARYSAVAVYKGIVMTVAEDRRFIMEAPAVAAVVSRVLASGVYLLNVDSEAEAAAIMVKAGMDIVGLPNPETKAAALSDDGHFSVFAPLGRASAAASPAGFSPHPVKRKTAAAREPVSGLSPTPRSPLSGVERLKALKAALDRKGLPKDQKDELSARLDRRVVLVESQLVGAAVRYEKLEAKGLDYVGKVRVAEQAISSGSLVEIFWRGPKGEPNRALGAPVSLDKAGGEVELSVDPAPRGDRITVAVGKISLIRRIKRSIFGE